MSAPPDDEISASNGQDGAEVAVPLTKNISDSCDDGETRLAVNLGICPECHKDKGRNLFDHLFTVHGYTKNDVEEARKQKRRWKLFTTASPCYICNVCNLPYKSKKSLEVHRREKEHYSDDGPILQLLLCPLCDARVQDQQELMSHVDKEHASLLTASNFATKIEREKRRVDQKSLMSSAVDLSSKKPPLSSTDFGNVQCPECKNLVKREHVGEHAIFAHGYTNRERQLLLLHLGVELTTPVPELVFKCEQCPKTYKRKQHLNDHVDSRHPNKDTSTGNAFACAFDKCTRNFGSNEQLANHCARVHCKEAGQQFKIISKSFNSMYEFLKWRSDAEKETSASFRYRCTSNFRTTEYACATTFVSKGEQEPQSKKAKTPEKCCPAFMKCRPRGDGTVDAIACFDHVGHPENPETSAEQPKEGVRGFLLSPENCDPTRECSECGEGPMTPVEMNIHWREVHGCSNIKDCEKVKDFYYSCEPCRFHCFTPTLMDSHMQVYHPNTSEEGLFKVTTPIPESITCEKCQMTFRTKYQLAVHCISFHGNLSCNSFIVQTSFNSWAQFQPWLEKMEKNTKSVLVKSAMQSFGQKIIHSHDCQFDKAVMSKSSETSKDKLKNCPAFVKVVENEDGVLDCVGFFDHLGHNEESLDRESPSRSKENVDKDATVSEPCILCGNDFPPEVDRRTTDYVQWLYCNVAECGSSAHVWCIQLLGNKCIKCEKGLLIERNEEPSSPGT